MKTVFSKVTYSQLVGTSSGFNSILSSSIISIFDCWKSSPFWIFLVGFLNILPPLTLIMWQTARCIMNVRTFDQCRFFSDIFFKARIPSKVFGLHSNALGVILTKCFYFFSYCPFSPSTSTLPRKYSLQLIPIEYIPTHNWNSNFIFLGLLHAYAILWAYVYYVI